MNRLPRTQRLKRALDAIDLIGPDGTAPELPFVQQLQAYFSEDEVWTQLEIAVCWGRYAELFTYHEESELFALEEPEAPERA